MKRAILTVGLGFGDEGKGATVDALTREYEADLVVRYCGGSQAGHNVQLPDGRRHTFSQFGAGTLVPRPAATYLGPRVVIDPPALRREAEHLAELGVKGVRGLVHIHPRCLVATCWHRTLNRLREASRGAARHGSCGQGIGEARSYWLRHGADALFAEDLKRPDVLRDKLELQRQRMLLEVQEFIDRIEAKYLAGLDLGGWSAEDEADHLTEGFAANLTAEVPPYRTAVLEGAQGVLLDEYRGFHPYTTWSTVTTHHAWELVEQMGAEAVAVLGLTRTYSTRHGEGPLPTYSPELTARLPDPGNPWNAWQGGFRCGWLDLPLIQYAIAMTGPLDGLVVNHLDQVVEGHWLCERYRNDRLVPAEVPNLAWQERLTGLLRQAEPVLVAVNAEELIERLASLAPQVFTGSGPTFDERSFEGLAFRRRHASSSRCPTASHREAAALV